MISGKKEIPIMNLWNTKFCFVADEVSQSEWSDDDDSDGVNRNNDGGDEESTGYVTDDPALDNMSVTNEHGLTDAEG